MTGNRALTGPEMAEFGVSDHCDQFCIMCHDHPPSLRNGESYSNSIRFGHCPPGLMSLDTFRSIIEDLQVMGTRRIEFAGRGDPLMNSSITEMVECAKKQGMHVMVYSNGSRLTQKLAEAFIGCELDILHISLNAGQPETYSRIHTGRTLDDYSSVIRNTRFVADRKGSLGSAVPFVQTSFIIGAVNHLEIDTMLHAASEMGAQKVFFTHASLGKGAGNGMKLSVEQFHDLREILTESEALAEELGLESNLSMFSCSVPHYLEQEVVGPAVVPCFVGWYTTFIIGNGCVMPCAQSVEPVGRVTEICSFTEIWHSRAYRRFRMAARSLPRKDGVLSLSECDRCTWRSKNIAIHNFIRPWRSIECSGEVEQLTLRNIRLRLVKKASRLWKRRWA